MSRGVPLTNMFLLTMITPITIFLRWFIWQNNLRLLHYWHKFLVLNKPIFVDTCKALVKCFLFCVLSLDYCILCHALNCCYAKFLALLQSLTYFLNIFPFARKFEFLKFSWHVYTEWTCRHIFHNGLTYRAAFVLRLFCSRLCTAGLPQYPETLPHGGHEDPGHTSGRQPCRSGGGTSQDGDPHRGRPAPGATTTQAEAQGHEHTDTVRLLRSQMASIAACYISFLMLAPPMQPPQYIWGPSWRHYSLCLCILSAGRDLGLTGAGHQTTIMGRKSATSEVEL